MSELLSKLLLGGTIVTVALTSSVAVNKVIQQAEASNEIEIAEVRTTSESENIFPEAPLTTPTGGAATSAHVFTLAELATHNTGTSCFVAYSNKVYDVTNNVSWRNCAHHGIRGGIDITSRFPHSVSYFASLPLVGTIDSGAGNSGATASNRGDDDVDEEDDEDESEVEDHEDESKEGREIDD